MQSFQISQEVDVNAYESHTALHDRANFYRQLTFQLLDFRFINKETILMFKMKARILHWQHTLKHYTNEPH